MYWRGIKTFWLEVRCQGSGFVLPHLSGQLSIVKTARVAQSTSAVWATAPFGGLGAITAMASSWGSGLLYMTNTH